MKRIILVLFIGSMCYGGAVPPFTTIYWRSVIDGDNPVHQPLSADSTTFFQILDADGGTPIVNVDSTNEYVGIGTSSPQVSLHVVTPNTVSAKIVCYRTDGKWCLLGAGEAGGAFTFDETGTFELDPRELITDTVRSSPYHGLLINGSNGRVGIGAPPTYSLTDDLEVGRAVGARLFVSDAGGADRQGVLIQSPGTAYGYGRLLVWDYDAGSGLHLALQEYSTSGNVGIGETAPETMLEISGATPYSTLHNTTHEDTDGGRESRLNFKGEQSGGEETTLARIEASHDGSSNDEKGQIIISTNNGGDSDTPTEGMRLSRAGLSTANDPNTLGVGVTTFICESNVMTITGDGGGNTIATITGAKSGTLLTLIFVDANVTITDTDAHTADTIDLAGAATNLTSADDTTLQIVYNGTSWYETGRSVN